MASFKPHSGSTLYIHYNILKFGNFDKLNPSTEIICWIVLVQLVSEVTLCLERTLMLPLA